jgi:hypothetical protein
MALLAAVTFDLADRHAVNADGVQRVAHVFEFEWFDDGHDELHVSVSFPGASAVVLNEMPDSALVVAGGPDDSGNAVGK